MPKVWNKRDKNCPKDAVYVGRPSKWGNPYRIGDKHPQTNLPMNRSQVIFQYKIYLGNSGLIDKISELKGKDLVCWCKPADCHADILLELANKE